MPVPIKVTFAIAGAQELDSVFSKVEARAKRLAQVQARAANDGAKAQDRASKTTERAAERASTASVKAVERAEQAKYRAVERWANQRVRAEERAAQQSKRIAEQEARAVQRARAKATMGVVGAAGRGVRSTLGTVGGIAGGIGLTAGVASVASALMSNLSLQEQAAQLVNATRDRSGAATQTVGGLTSLAQTKAAQYGVSAESIMGGMATVAAKAGGSKGLADMQESLDDMIKTAKAYGVSMEDMGAVTAAALKADVKPGAELNELLQDIAAMGKEGAIEIKDLAGELGKLGGAGKMTELRGGAMLRRQVGMAQIAEAAAVSPEESRTAIVDVIRDISTHGAKLRKAGVDTIGAGGLQKDPAIVISEAIGAAFGKGIDGKKGSEALNAIFTGNSQKLVASLLPEFQKAGGGVKGVEAVRNYIEGKSGAKLGAGERDAAFATAMGTGATKIAQATEDFKAKVGELMPEFVKLMPAITSATKAFAELAVYVAGNPIKSLGVLLAANVAKEIAAAKLSETIQRAVLGGAGAGGVPGAGGAAVGGLATAGAIAAIAITATAVTLTGMKVIDKSFEESKETGAKVFGAYAEIQNAARGEPTSPEKLARMKEGLEAGLAAERATSTEAQKRILRQSTLTSDFNPLAALAGMVDFAKAKMQQQQQGIAKGAELEAAAASFAKLEANANRAADMLALLGGSARDGKPVSSMGGR